MSNEEILKKFEFDLNTNYFDGTKNFQTGNIIYPFYVKDEAEDKLLLKILNKLGYTNLFDSKDNEVTENCRTTRNATSIYANDNVMYVGISVEASTKMYFLFEDYYEDDEDYTCNKLPKYLKDFKED